MAKFVMTATDVRDASVSVVIPSYGRHLEVARAVKSALNQTRPPLEVIVANDGPDRIKAQLLAELDDIRVIFKEAPRRGNASATRNFGIQHARGDWVALLDDDDIWLPAKLETQFAAAGMASRGRCLILAGTERVHHLDGRFSVRPKTEVPLGIGIDELLFSSYDGVNTSTLMAPRTLFERYPFVETLERHEDWQWLLNAGEEAQLIVTSEVVCERYVAPGTGLTRPGGYEISRAWYLQNCQRMSKQTRAAIVSSILSRKAAYDNKFTVLPWLTAETVRYAGLTPKIYARLLMPWIIPCSVRNWGRSMLGRIKS